MSFDPPDRKAFAPNCAFRPVGDIDSASRGLLALSRTDVTAPQLALRPRGVIRCSLVRPGEPKSSPLIPRSVRRFTVSLDPREYEQLNQLARGHRPPLSLQYVVRYAIRLLLDRADDPELAERLGDPVDAASTDH